MRSLQSNQPPLLSTKHTQGAAAHRIYTVWQLFFMAAAHRVYTVWQLYLFRCCRRVEPKCQAQVVTTTGSLALRVPPLTTTFAQCRLDCCWPAAIGARSTARQTQCRDARPSAGTRSRCVSKRQSATRRWREYLQQQSRFNVPNVHVTVLAAANHQLFRRAKGGAHKVFGRVLVTLEAAHRLRAAQIPQSVRVVLGRRQQQRAARIQVDGRHFAQVRTDAADAEAADNVPHLPIKTMLEWQRARQQRTRMVLSLDAETIRLPNGLKRTPDTLERWPRNTRLALPLWQSHSRTSRS